MTRVLIADDQALLRASFRLLVDVMHEPVNVDVTDDRPGVRELGKGHGLPGMRGRVAVYGGTFNAGPGPNGGFRVEAELPIR